MNSMVGISFISWALFFILSAVYFFPSQTLKTINNSILPEYIISFSGVSNEGTVLKPILTFSNLAISQQSIKIFSADQSSIGLNISPRILFGNLDVNFLHAEKAYLRIQANLDGASSFLNITIDNNQDFISSDIKILDLGCGTGNHLKLLKKYK